MSKRFWRAVLRPPFWVSTQVTTMVMRIRYWLWWRKFWRVDEDEKMKMFNDFMNGDVSWLARSRKKP